LAVRALPNLTPSKMKAGASKQETWLARRTWLCLTAGVCSDNVPDRDECPGLLWCRATLSLSLRAPLSQGQQCYLSFPEGKAHTDTSLTETKVSTVLQILHAGPVTGRPTSGHLGFKCLRGAQKAAGEEGRKGSARHPRMLDTTTCLTLANSGNQHLAKKRWFHTLWSLGHILNNVRLAGFGGVLS